MNTMSKVERMQSMLPPESNQEQELNDCSSFREKIPIEDENGATGQPQTTLRRPSNSSHPSPRSLHPPHPPTPSPPPSSSPRSAIRHPSHMTRTSSPPSRLHLLPLSATRRTQPPKATSLPSDNPTSQEDSASHRHQLTPKPSPKGMHTMALEQLAFAPFGWPRAPLIHSPAPSPSSPRTRNPHLTDSNSSNTSSSLTRRTYFQRRYSARQVPFFVPLYGHPDALPCSRSLHPDKQILLQVHATPPRGKDRIQRKDAKAVPRDISKTTTGVSLPPVSSTEPPVGALRSSSPRAETRPTAFSKDKGTLKVTKLMPIEEKSVKNITVPEESNNDATGLSDGHHQIDQLQKKDDVTSSVGRPMTKIPILGASTVETGNNFLQKIITADSKQGNINEEIPVSGRRAGNKITQHPYARPTSISRGADQKRFLHEQIRTSHRLPVLKLKSIHRPATLSRVIENNDYPPLGYVFPTRKFDRSKCMRNSRIPLSQSERSTSRSQSCAPTTDSRHFKPGTNTMRRSSRHSPVRAREPQRQHLSSSSDEGIAERSMVQRSSLNMVPDLLPVPSSRMDDFSSEYNRPRSDAYDSDDTFPLKTMFQRRKPRTSPRGSSGSSLSSTESSSRNRKLDSEILLWRKNNASALNETPSQGNSFTTFRIKLLRHGSKQTDEQGKNSVHPLPNRRRRSEVVPYENRYRQRHRKSMRQEMWRRCHKSHGSDRGSLHDLASLPEEGSIHSESEETTQQEMEKQEPRRTESPIRVRMRVKEGISVRVKGHESTLVSKDPLTDDETQGEGKWATTLAWSQKLNMSKDVPKGTFVDPDNEAGSNLDPTHKKSERIKLMHGVQNNIEDYDVPLKRVSSSTDIDVSISIRDKGLSQEKESSVCARELPMAHNPEAHEMREWQSKHQRKIKSIPNLTHDEVNEGNDENYNQEQLLAPKRRQSKYRSRGTMQRKGSLEQQSVETSSHGDTISPFGYSDQESFRSKFRIQTKKSLPEMTVSEDTKRNGPHNQEIVKQSLKPGSEISSLLFYRNGVPTFFHISSIPPTGKSCPSLPSDQAHDHTSDSDAENAANVGERRRQIRADEESGRGMEGHHPPCTSSPLMLEDIRMSLSDRFPSFVSSAAFDTDMNCSCQQRIGFLCQDTQSNLANVCCCDDPQCREPNAQEEIEEREIAVHEFLEELSAQPLVPPSTSPTPPDLPQDTPLFTCPELTPLPTSPLSPSPPRSPSPPPFLVHRSRSPSPAVSAATDQGSSAVQPLSSVSPESKESPTALLPSHIGRARVRRPRKEDRRFGEGIVIRDSPAPAAFGAAIRSATPRLRKRSYETSSVQIEIHSTETRGTTSTKGSSPSPSLPRSSDKERRSAQATQRAQSPGRTADRNALEMKKQIDTLSASSETRKQVTGLYKGLISKRDALRTPTTQRQHELKITVNTVVQRSPVKVTRKSPRTSDASSKETYKGSPRERSSSSQRRQSRTKTLVTVPSPPKSRAPDSPDEQQPQEKFPSQTPSSHKESLVSPSSQPSSETLPTESPPSSSREEGEPQLTSLARGDIAVAEDEKSEPSDVPTTLEQSMESSCRSTDKTWVAKPRVERPVMNASIEPDPAPTSTRTRTNTSKDSTPAQRKRERASPVRSSPSSPHKSHSKNRASKYASSTATPQRTAGVSSSSSKSKLSRSPSRQRSRSKSSRHSILKGSSLQYELAPIQEHSSVSVARPPASTVSDTNKWWQGCTQDGQGVRVLWSTSPDKWLHPRPSPENPFVTEEDAKSPRANRNPVSSSGSQLESSKHTSNRERKTVHESGEETATKTGTIRSAPAYARDRRDGKTSEAEKPYEEGGSSHRRPSAVLSHPSRTPTDKNMARSASKTQPTMAAQSKSKDLEFFASERVLRETWFTDIPRSSSLKKTTPSGNMVDPSHRSSMEFRLAQVSPKASKEKQCFSHHKSSLRKKRTSQGEGRKSRLLGGPMVTTSNFTASGSDVSRITEQLCAIQSRKQNSKEEDGDKSRGEKRDREVDRRQTEGSAREPKNRLRKEDGHVGEREDKSDGAVTLLWSRPDEKKTNKEERNKKVSSTNYVEVEHIRPSRVQDRHQHSSKIFAHRGDNRPWMAGAWTEEARAWARAAVCREKFIHSARSWWPGGGAPLTCPWCFSTCQPIEDSNTLPSTCPVAAICTAGCLPLLRMLFGGGESPVRLRCGKCRRFLGSWDEQRSRLRPVRLPPLPPPPSLPSHLTPPAPPPCRHHGARPRTREEVTRAPPPPQPKKKEERHGEGLEEKLRWTRTEHREEQEEHHHEHRSHSHSHTHSHSQRSHTHYEFSSVSPAHRTNTEEPKLDCLASWQKPWPSPQQRSSEPPQLLMPFRIPPPPAPQMSTLRSHHCTKHPPLPKW